MTHAAMTEAVHAARGVPSALLLFALAFAAGIALAVPPPPQREARVVDLRGADETALEGEVRAYDGESFEFEAHAGEVLLARMVDAGGVLSLSLESPSGAPLIDGARPAADGLRVVLAESGTWRVWVRMDAEAARRGRSARFVLALRLLR
jgi:hypothetical protein